MAGRKLTLKRLSKNNYYNKLVQPRSSDQASGKRGRPASFRMSISNIAFEISSNELEELFSSEVGSPVKVILEPSVHAPHAGHGYLEFKTEEAANTAYDLMDGCDLGGSKISLKVEFEKEAESNKEQPQEVNPAEVIDMDVEDNVLDPDVVCVEDDGDESSSRQTRRSSEKDREMKEVKAKIEKDYQREKEREREERDRNLRDDRERNSQANRDRNSRGSAEKNPRGVRERTSRFSREQTSQEDLETEKRDRSPRLKGREEKEKYFEGVMVVASMGEMTRHSKGADFRVHFSNIHYNVKEVDVITLVNKRVRGLRVIATFYQNSGTNHKGVMMLSFDSGRAAVECADKLNGYRFYSRALVAKTDFDATQYRSAVPALLDAPPAAALPYQQQQQHPLQAMPLADDMLQDPYMRLEPRMDATAHPVDYGHQSSHGGSATMLELERQMRGGGGHQSMGHDASRLTGIMGDAPRGPGILHDRPALMTGGARMAAQQPQMMGATAMLSGQESLAYGMNQTQQMISQQQMQQKQLQQQKFQQEQQFQQQQKFQQEQQFQQQQLQQQQQKQPIVGAGLSANPAASSDTYGLSDAFLDTLNIKLPLVKEILVSNIDHSSTEDDVKELFGIAGTVVKVQYNQVKGQAVVEMVNPLDAVQSISMLHNQEYFDKKINVRMLRPNDPDNLVTRSIVAAVPRGLKTIGKGLGVDGLPLTTAQCLNNSRQDMRQPAQPQRSPVGRGPTGNDRTKSNSMYNQRSPAGMNRPDNALPRSQGPPPAALNNRNDLNGERGAKSWNEPSRVSRWNQKSPKSAGGNQNNKRPSSQANNSLHVGGNKAADANIDYAALVKTISSINANLPGSSYQKDGRNDGPKIVQSHIKEYLRDVGRFDSAPNDRPDNAGRSNSRFSDDFQGRNKGRENNLPFQRSGSSNLSANDREGGYQNSTKSSGYSNDSRNAGGFNSKNYDDFAGGNRKPGFPQDKPNMSGGLLPPPAPPSLGYSNTGRSAPLFPSGIRGAGYQVQDGTNSQEQNQQSSSRNFGASKPLIGSTTLGSTVGREVILTNLPSNARQQNIRDMCLPYGAVQGVQINSRHRTGRVVFDNYQQANMAADILNNQEYNGATMKAMLA